MLERRVARICRLEILARSSLAHNAHAEGKEPFAVGFEQPGGSVLLFNRIWRIGRSLDAPKAEHNEARNEENGAYDQHRLLAVPDMIFIKEWRSRRAQRLAC